MASLFYSILYLYRGSLPWQGLRADSKEQKYELIREKKVSTPLHVLCSDMPNDVEMLLQYVYCLKPNEEPNYTFLCKTVRNMFACDHFQRDYVFDWQQACDSAQNQHHRTQLARPSRLQAPWTKDDEAALISLFLSLGLDSKAVGSTSTAADTSRQTGSILPGAAAKVNGPFIQEDAEEELEEHPRVNEDEGECNDTTSYCKSSVPQPTVVKLVDVERHTGPIRQLKSNPISQDQLAAEVRNIYNRLVELDTKCRMVHAALKANPHRQLAPEQWQTLVKLHRTLMHEHCDFLMASQRPSATPSLLGLAETYNTPSRLWYHGIGPFLVVLHQRRPGSQDYAVWFIRVAYQMMGLLMEIMPSFFGAWAECAANILRIGLSTMPVSVGRLALTAAMTCWYNNVKDQYPALGRVAHRLGAIESPSLRQFSLYTTALTSVVPFPPARESLRRLCHRIIQGIDNDCSEISHVEYCTILYHANAFLLDEGVDLDDGIIAGLEHVGAASAENLHKWAGSLVVMNVSVLLQYGSSTNVLCSLLRSYNAAAAPVSGPGPEPLHRTSDCQAALATTCSSHARKTVYSSFISLLQHGAERQRTVEVLPAIAIMLIWMHKLCTLQPRMGNFANTVADSPLLPPSSFWDALAALLNEVGSQQPIGTELVQAACEGILSFGTQDRRRAALPEDRSIRGLLWAHPYFTLALREDTQIKSLAVQDMDTSRRKRILSLGLRLSSMTSELEFDAITRTFSTSHTAHSANVKSTSLRENNSSALSGCAAWESAGCDAEFESPRYDASISD